MESKHQVELDRILATLKKVVALLVNKEYARLDEITKGVWVSAEQLTYYIREHEAPLVMPPEAAYSDVYFYEDTDEGETVYAGNADSWSVCICRDADGSPTRWIVEFNVWTVNEQPSSYTLILEMTDIGKEELEVKVQQMSN